MDFAAWLSGEGRQSCRECRETYERAGRPTPWDPTPPEKIDPPCGDCRPALLPEAAAVADILVRVQTQWLLDGQGVPMALRYEAVESVAARLGFSDRDILDVVDQVMELGGIMVEGFRRKAENKG